MPANTNPIFALTPIAGWATITAANTATDGTGTVNLVLTIGGNGGRLDRVRLVPLGTNIASKAYLFLNNGSDPTVAANNALLGDIPLPGTTASNTALIGAPIELAIGLVLPASYRVYATLATAVASGWKVGAFGGSF